VFKNTRKTRIIVSSLLTVLAVNLTPVATYATQSFTNCPLRGQENSNWCWDACTQMLAETKGYFRSQSDICTHVYGKVDNNTASAAQVREATAWATGYSLQFDLTYSALPFDGSGSVVGSINNGWSINAGCAPGHMMVITGYDTANNNVWLQDPQGTSTNWPARGFEQWCRYDSLISGDYRNSSFAYLWNFKWECSIN